MGKRSAQISSPDIIKTFRSQFIEFDQECRKELDGVATDVNQILAWLQGEQKANWKRQLRKREEEYEEAKRAFTYVKFDTSPMKKKHIEDERKAMKMAERRKEEAVAKLRQIDRWTATIQHEALNDLKPCESLSSHLSSLTPKVIARLDSLLDNLEVYLHSLPSGGADRKKGKEG